MGYLVIGIVVLVGTLTGGWASLPGANGVAKPFVTRGGADAWIAIGITIGIALGIGALIVGFVDVFGPFGNRRS